MHAAPLFRAIGLGCVATSRTGGSAFKDHHNMRGFPKESISNMSTPIPTLAMAFSSYAISGPTAIHCPLTS